MADRSPEGWPAAFAAVLGDPAPPPAWPAPLAALWWLARRPAEAGAAGPAWARAHALVQDAPGPDAAWVHAHLHRIEGDDGNAGYWYRRAGRTASQAALPEEAAAIAAALLAR